MNAFDSYEKIILIACSMIEDEINAVFERFECRDIEVRWQERGYHDDPDKLREFIQGEITRAESDGADLILLAYGLCGKGAAGWHTERAVLAMPRFDDCVNMMLCTGKRERRNYLEAGNMYLTNGWSKEEGALLSMYKKMQDRYGERRGLKAMKLMFDSYSKVTVIDTGCYELGPVKEYARAGAELLGLEQCLVAGGNEVLVKLITGNLDEDIIVKMPGESVGEEDFEFGGESAGISTQLWMPCASTDR